MRLKHTASTNVDISGTRTEILTRMEEEARKLLEEGITKKLLSPGKGELSSTKDGTKVNRTRQRVPLF